MDVWFASPRVDFHTFGVSAHGCDGPLSAQDGSDAQAAALIRPRSSVAWLVPRVNPRDPEAEASYCFGDHAAAALAIEGSLGLSAASHHGNHAEVVRDRKKLFATALRGGCEQLRPHGRRTQLAFVDPHRCLPTACKHTRPSAVRREPPLRKHRPRNQRLGCSRPDLASSAARQGATTACDPQVGQRFADLFLRKHAQSQAKRTTICHVSFPSALWHTGER